MQEERRLAYVGITRAKKRLYLSASKSRTLFGKTSHNRPSRFLAELPEGLVDVRETERPSLNGLAGAAKTAGRKADVARSKVISGQVQVQQDKNRYKVGMRVKHRSFGEGLIIGARPMASDMLLEIAFDKSGTKKLMANYANLEII